MDAPDTGTFATGETLSGPGTQPGDEYLGTVDINGETVIVVGNPNAWANDLAGSSFTGFVAAADPGTYDPVNPVNNFPKDNVTSASFTVCFAAGTLIATPDGETKVEALKIGDLITCEDGRAVPVKWIGRQTVHKIFTPAERFVPVRVSAGALGNGQPHCDLVLTADHALILDGLAINASALVNGTTIAYEPIDSLPDRVTYYHIETENHDVILANGAPAETYVDYIARRAFDNHAEYLALYGEENPIREMPLPRVSAARLVPPAIRARLVDRSAA
ncbi:Hint domain-containing protein [Sedimentitalea sp. CAU 1593]|uniref:Hint domain-containing protein n=2 Tax=Sedimentitalea arenosa TaxID=2798803 RepID=A0A8J7J910_9RHOB|nr:Hint domain-containing protein [Arenibacterium arenosum]